MEPMHSVSYYLEFQKQLSTSKGSSRKQVFFSSLYQAPHLA
jgi:hypothetical protein